MRALSRRVNIPIADEQLLSALTLYTVSALYAHACYISEVGLVCL